MKKRAIVTFLCAAAVVLLPTLNFSFPEHKITLKPNEVRNITQEFPIDTQYIGTIGTTLVCVNNDITKGFDKSSKVLFELGEFDITFIRGDLIICQKGEEYRFFSADGKELDGNNYANALDDWVGASDYNVWEDTTGHFGYINKKGAWLIPPKFAYAGEFGEGYAYVENYDGTVGGLLNVDGEFTKLCIQDGTARDMVVSDGALLCQTYGDRNSETVSTFITTDNKLLPVNNNPVTISAPNYPFQNAKSFNEGLACVQRGNLWGYLNKDGEVAIERQYKNAYSFSGGCAVVVKNDDSFGLINKNGEEVSEFIHIPGYQFTGEYHQGLYRIKSEDGWNLCDETGKIVFGSDYNYVYWDAPFWNIALDITSTYCYFPVSGRVVESWSYKQINENTLWVKSLRSGLYDMATGDYLFASDKIGEYSEGLLTATDKYGIYGYIDITGKWVIAPQFIEAYEFHDGVAFVVSEEKAGLITNPLEDKGTILSSSS